MLHIELMMTVASSVHITSGEYTSDGTIQVTVSKSNENTIEWNTRNENASNGQCKWYKNASYR